MQKITKRKLLITFLSKNKGVLLLTIVFGLLSSFFTLLIPIGISKYYELFFGVDSKKADILDLLPASWFSSISSFALTFLCMILLRQLFYFLQRYYTAFLGELFVKGLREMLFKQQMRISLAVYEEYGTGKYLLRYSGDLNSLRRYLSVGIVRFIIDTVLLLGAILTLFLFNKVLIMVVLFGVFVAGIGVFILNKYLHRTSSVLRDKKSGLLAFVNRSLLSIEMLKTFNRHKVTEKRFNKRSDIIFKQSMKYHFLNSIISTLILGLLYASLLGVLYVAYLLINNQKVFGIESASINTDQLLVYLLVMITIIPVLRRFLKVSTRWKLGNISFRKLIKVLNTETENIDVKGGRRMFKGEGDIVFKDIRLADLKGRGLLDCQTVKVEIGKSTVILHEAENWQAKFVREFLRLEPLEIGDISIKNKSIMKIGGQSLRKHIAVLSLRLPIGGRSVYESISPAKSTEKKERAILMLKRLQKYSIDESHIGIDDFLSEQSVNLSEDQLLTIVAARAFLADKDLLVIEDLERFREFENFKTIKEMILEYKEQGRTIIFLETAPVSSELSELTDSNIILQ